MSLARLAAFALLLSVLGYCASPASASASNPVSLRVSLTPTDPHPGEIVTATISARIDPGWHLYSLVPTPAPGPTATSFTVAGTDVSLAGSASEDAPVVEQDPNFNKQVAFHEITAKFTVPIRIAQGASPGRIAASIEMQYQICNNSTCLPPKTVNLALSITVVAGNIRPAYAISPVPPAAPLASIKPLTMGQTGPSGLVPFAAAAFVAGLLALLTPCVFPLIPVTFGFFTKQVGGDQRRLIALAATYAGGIILSFMLLGVVSSLIFGAAGANKIAANPWFNLFFGILFVVFAFSFFESFIIQLPQGLSRFASPTRAGSGIGSVLLMGLAFVFAAFTCTAPFIGSILVAAASASDAHAWTRPLVGMLFFALALALPFFALALFPTLLSKLPKSGGWMTRFKAALGFVELAYALTYFSKADLVWQAGILTRPVIFALWAVIAIAGALYLLGLLRVAAYPDESSRLTPGRWISAAIFALAGVYCLYALTGRPVNGLVLAYLPPDGYGPQLANASNAAADDPTWLTSYNDALAQSKSSGKPIFIDFTGYTCTNCRYVEQNIFTKTPVKEALADNFVRVRLYTDGGKDGPANQAFQQTKFGTVALPLYAVVSPNGQTVAQLGGSASSVAQFAEFMSKGEQLAKASTTPVPSANAAAWASYTDAALSDARSAQRPVIIDFTASWCTNCHELERKVFTDPLVAPKLAAFTTLRADLTNFYSPANASLEKQYNIVQLPVVLFLDANGHEIPGTRVTGVVTASDFAGRMDRTTGQKLASSQ